MKAREKFPIDVTWTASVKKQRLTNQSATFSHSTYYSLWQRTLPQNKRSEHFIQTHYNTPFLLKASTRRLFLPFIIEDVIGEETLTPFCIYHRSKIPCLSLWRL